MTMHHEWPNLPGKSWPVQLLGCCSIDRTKMAYLKLHVAYLKFSATPTPPVAADGELYTCGVGDGGQLGVKQATPPPAVAPMAEDVTVVESFGTVCEEHISASE
jgi:hypothetical protein